MQVNELKSLLSRFHVRPDKKLGQNFLLSENVLEQIVDAAQLSKQDTVLEVGPGLGFLTRLLAERAGKVIAVEKDRQMCRALRKILKRYKNVRIICEDILFVDLNELFVSDTANLTFSSSPISERIRGEVTSGSGGYKIVANIPYYLTGKILQKFLNTESDSNLRMHPNDTNPPHPSSPTRGEELKERGRHSGHSGEDSGHSGRHAQHRPSLLVLLVQKEVAERIVAKPGEMSILSVSVQFYSDPEIIEFVGKENFYPVPEVDSAIVRLNPLPQSLPPREGKDQDKKFLPLDPSLFPSLEGRGKGRVREWTREFRPRFDVDPRKFFQLVKIGFSNKRKQLQNNLQEFFPLPQSLPPGEGKRKEASSPLMGEGRERVNYKTLLSSLGLNPLCRAQDLSLEDWRKLYSALFNNQFL